MYTCAACAVYACRENQKEKAPKNCPMHQHQLMDQAFREYSQDENHSFYVTASELEALGYCQWPRVRETIELCLRMGYKKVGMAFCWGLRNEAKVVDKLFRRAGIQLISVICKTGCIDKSACGIPEEHTLRPGQHESMCNPIAQAMLLNEQETEFNIVLGLCVGHDSMFYKYSHALVTTLVAKDRVLAHNPAGALYCADGYFQKKLL